MSSTTKMFLLLSALALNSAACIWIPDYDLDQDEKTLMLDAGDDATISLKFSNDDLDNMDIYLEANPVFEMSPLPATEDCENCLSKQPSGDLAPQHIVLELSRGGELVKRWEAGEEEDFSLKGRDQVYRSDDDDGQTIISQPWSSFSWYGYGEDALTGEGQTDGYLELDYTFNGDPRTLVAEFELSIDDNGEYLIELVGGIIYVIASLPFAILCRDGCSLQ